MHLKIYEDGNKTRLIGLSVSNFSQKQEYEGLPFHSLSILAYNCNFTMLPLFLDSAIKSSLWRDAQLQETKRDSLLSHQPTHPNRKARTPPR
jgi:hypothetical protein